MRREIRRGGGNVALEQHGKHTHTPSPPPPQIESNCVANIVFPTRPNHGSALKISMICSQLKAMIWLAATEAQLLLFI